MIELSNRVKVVKIEDVVNYNKCNLILPLSFTYQYFERGKNLSKEIVLDRDDYVYLQDDYSITLNIIKKENIIYESQDESWIDYCNSILEFDML